MLYELMPLSFIIEQAGGMASNGQQPILDIHPTNVHMTQPVFIGSSDNVNECLTFLAKYDFPHLLTDEHDEEKINGEK